MCEAISNFLWQQVFQADNCSAKLPYDKSSNLKSFCNSKIRNFRAKSHERFHFKVRHMQRTTIKTNTWWRVHNICLSSDNYQILRFCFRDVTVYINGLRTERTFCKIHVTLSVRRQLDVDKLKFIVLWVVISNTDGGCFVNL